MSDNIHRISLEVVRMLEDKARSMRLEVLELEKDAKQIQEALEVDYKGDDFLYSGNLALTRANGLLSKGGFNVAKIQTIQSLAIALHKADRG